MIAQEETYEAYLKKFFMALVFVCILIASAGLGLDLTVKIRERVQSGETVPAETHPRNPDYQAALLDMITENGNYNSALTRSRAEVIRETYVLH